MPFPTDEETRSLVLAAFNEDNAYFYNETPHRYNQFIDGMAWIGAMTSAALKVGDMELASKGVSYLQRVIDVGQDARTYAPLRVKDDWLPSLSLNGMWFYRKPQESAGPLGLQMAVSAGAIINVPKYLKEKTDAAKRLTSFGFAWGLLARTGLLLSNANSMFMAYAASDKKPPSTMTWLCEENPFFSYVARKRCSVEYPPRRRFVAGKEEKKSKIQPFKSAEPSIWPFRRDPFKLYSDGGSGETETTEYTPVYKLTGDYLQSLL